MVFVGKVVPPAIIALVPEPTTESLLTDLLERLNSNTGCVVLRNAHTLPETTANDIDLLVAPGDVPLVRAAVAEVCHKHCWRVVTEVDKQGYAAQWLMSPGEDPVFFPVDCFTDLSWHGHRFADVTYGLSTRRQTEKGVWTVRPGFEAATTLCKEILPWGKLKEKSRARVQELSVADPEGFRETLLPYLGAALTQDLLGACLAGEWEKLAPLSRRARRAVRRFTPSGIGRVIGFTWQSLRHHLDSRLSAFVVLVGPDGSGKTTIADELQKRMAGRPFKTTWRCKVSFGILPEMKMYRIWLLRALGRKAERPKEAAAGTRHVGMSGPLPVWRAVMYELYYAMDLALGRMKLLRWRGRWGLVLFDRYFSDYYFMRGHMNVPRWLLRTIERLVPRPELVIYLDRDAEEIYAKKPELTVEELKRQQRIIREVMGPRTNFRCVDAREGVEATVRAVEKLVIAHLVEKGKRTVLA